MIIGVHFAKKKSFYFIGISIYGRVYINSGSNDDQEIKIRLAGCGFNVSSVVIELSHNYRQNGAVPTKVIVFSTFVIIHCVIIQGMYINPHVNALIYVVKPATTASVKEESEWGGSSEVEEKDDLEIVLPKRKLEESGGFAAILRNLPFFAPSELQPETNGYSPDYPPLFHQYPPCGGFHDFSGCTNYPSADVAPVLTAATNDPTNVGSSGLSAPYASPTNHSHQFNLMSNLPSIAYGLLANIPETQQYSSASAGAPMKFSANGIPTPPLSGCSIAPSTASILFSFILYYLMCHVFKDLKKIFIK